MNRHYLTPLVAILAALWLSACVTPASVPVESPEQRALQLQALSDYQVTGGLGIWTDEQSMSARIDWKETAGVLNLKISGPLGIGNLQLVSEPGIATLTRANKVISQGSSVDTVVQRGLGLRAPVPIKQLQQWVKGLPGNAKSVEQDEQGKLSSLEFTDKQGTRWQARFLKYTGFNGLAVPALITASGGPYSVRLILKDWQRGAKDVVPAETQSDRRLAIPQR